jgi:hypothetical protein
MGETRAQTGGHSWTAHRRAGRQRTVHAHVPRWAVYTSGQMLGERPKTCHFLPLFGTPGVSAGWQGAVAKSFPGKQIGSGMLPCWDIKMPRGMRRAENCHVKWPPVFNMSSHAKNKPDGGPQRTPSTTCPPLLRRGVASHA